MGNKVMLQLLMMMAMGVVTSLAVSTAWRPVVPGQLTTSILHQEAAAYTAGIGQSNFGNYDESPLSQQVIQEQDQCALYKVGMSQQLYFEVSNFENLNLKNKRDLKNSNHE